MVKNRVGKWVAVRPQRLSFTVALVTLLVCGVVLLSQVGCQQEASKNKSPAVQGPSAGSSPAAKAEQPPAAAQKTAAEKPAVAGAVAESKPAQTQAQSQPAGAAPKVEIKTMTQDLGDIGPETTHTTKFEFKNVGNAPLKVAHVKGCCGSVVRGVKDGQEFAPGESGALDVEYRTGTYPGALVRKITMETNDLSQPEGVVNLTIKANVVYRIEHFPSRLNLFPKKENAGCIPITLKSTDGKPFSITGFRATANTLTAEFDPSVKATEFVLKPKVDAEKLARNTKGQISINLTHPECANVFIPYDVLPEFSVTPSQLTLFNIKASQPLQREIWVLSNYDEDFDIDSVTSQRGAMKLLESKKIPGVAKPEGSAGDAGKAGARYQLKIEITPPAMEDKRSILSDVLELKLKTGETLTVQCRGFYAAN